VQLENLGLRPQRSDTNWAAGPIKQAAPLGNPSKSQESKLISGELSPSRVNPEHVFVLPGAKEDHVMIRRHDNLSGLASVSEDLTIGGTPERLPVLTVSDMACVEPQNAESSGDTPGQQLIEQESHLRALNLNAAP
jgi:hypothetical protein